MVSSCSNWRRHRSKKGFHTPQPSDNPDAVARPIWSGYRGWILSGHTHGGQCKPPGFAPPLLPVANKRYTAGEFDLKDGRHLYINRGLGYLIRARFNARPEITAFTFVAEST